MARWLLVHLRKDNPFGPSVLSGEGFEILQKGALPFPNDPNDRYAMGWSDERWGGVRILSHYGSWIGYHANMLIAPETGDGLVLLTNAESYTGNRLRWEIAKNAFRRMLGQKEVPRAWFDASVAGVLSLSALASALLVWTVHGIIKARRRTSRGHAVWRPVAIGTALAAGIYFGVPQAFDADLVSIWWTTPDAGYAIAAGIVLSILGGIANALAVWRSTSRK